MEIQATKEGDVQSQVMWRLNL